MIEFTTFIQMIIAAVLINNVLLQSFLGIEVIEENVPSPKEIFKLLLALVISVPFASGLGYVVYHQVLFSMNELGEVTRDLTYFMTLISVVIVVIVMLTVAQLIKKVFPKVHELHVNYTNQLITTSLVLGSVLIIVASAQTLLESVLLGVFISIGYGLVLMFLTLIERQLVDAPVLKGFRGLPLRLIILAIIALIVSGFSG